MGVKHTKLVWRLW